MSKMGKNTNKIACLIIKSTPNMVCHMFSYVTNNICSRNNLKDNGKIGNTEIIKNKNNKNKTNIK